MFTYARGGNKKKHYILLIKSIDRATILGMTEDFAPSSLRRTWVKARLALRLAFGTWKYLIMLSRQTSRTERCYCQLKEFLAWFASLKASPPRRVHRWATSGVNRSLPCAIIEQTNSTRRPLFYTFMIHSRISGLINQIIFYFTSICVTYNFQFSSPKPGICFSLEQGGEGNLPTLFSFLIFHLFPRRSKQVPASVLS